MIDIYIPQNKTPIEVALQVDEDGTVSAKKVYEFLGLNSSNYSKWCRNKILDNEFAEENVDYMSFVLKDERNPKPTTDYKLTIAFAKKLCMLQKNERGEQARDYFLKVEEKLKQTATENKPIIKNMEMLRAMFNVLEQHQDEIEEIKEDIQQLKEQKPKEIIVLDKQETVFSKINAYSSTAVGKAFNLSAVALHGILQKENILKKIKVMQINGKEVPRWIIDDKYRNCNYSIQKYFGVTHSDKKAPTEFTFAWTPKGVGFIVELLKHKGYTQVYELDNRTRARRVSIRQS